MAVSSRVRAGEAPEMERSRPEEDRMRHLRRHAGRFLDHEARHADPEREVRRDAHPAAHVEERGVLETVVALEARLFLGRSVGDDPLLRWVLASRLHEDDVLGEAAGQRLQAAIDGDEYPRVSRGRLRVGRGGAGQRSAGGRQPDDQRHVRSCVCMRHLGVPLVKVFTSTNPIVQLRLRQEDCAARYGAHGGPPRPKSAGFVKCRIGTATGCGNEYRRLSYPYPAPFEAGAGSDPVYFTGCPEDNGGHPFERQAGWRLGAGILGCTLDIRSRARFRRSGRRTSP